MGDAGEPDLRRLDDVLDEAENKTLSPELRKALEFVNKTISQLKDGDLLRRVDALVDINDIISALGNKQANETPGADASPATSESDIQAQALIKKSDDLLDAFTKVMNDIFSYPTSEIPLRFTKYFITIVNKTCS